MTFLIAKILYAQIITTQYCKTLGISIVKEKFGSVLR